MFNIETKYERATVVQSEDGLSNVVKSIYIVVSVVNTETGLYNSIGEDIDLPPPVGNIFVEFDQLTKEEVDSWIADNEQYLALVEKTKGGTLSNIVTTKVLPWNVLPPPPDVPANNVPFAVTPLQIRRAINEMGLREFVEGYVQTLSRSEQDAWEYATIVERTNPILASGAAALGKTEEDLDNLFILANSFV